MDIFNNPNLKLSNILKFAGIVIVLLIVLTFVFRLLGSSVNSFIYNKKQVSPSMGGMPAPMVDADYGYNMVEESMTAGSVAQDLSVRNVANYYDPYATGDDGESYEITDYRATIETRNLAQTCGTISDLKPKDYIIFESANEAERNCSYSFKVANANVEEVLSVINSLDPKELSESTYTIKNVIEDFTDELEVLEKKRDSIETTLNDAINSYDEIAEIATRANDAESLSRIIDSKIRIIERLTQEKININTQIDRLSRTKAEQLDRLEYTSFYVSVYESKFVDGQQLKDSWKREVKAFVQEINATLQDISINLVALLFRLMQWVLYLVIILIVVKYGWRYGQRFWKE